MLQFVDTFSGLPIMTFLDSLRFPYPSWPGTSMEEAERLLSEARQFSAFHKYPYRIVIVLFLSLPVVKTVLIICLCVASSIIARRLKFKSFPVLW